MNKTPLCSAALAAVLLATSMTADDGMWLLNKPPVKELKERYGFTPTPEWLEHVQKASVRFNNGGSGSFASADGLVITNHHVGADALYKLSTSERNLLEKGYLAKGPSDELKCLDLELNVLMEIEDVRDRVKAAVKPGLSPADANSARRAVMAAIEKESLERTGLRSDVVTLYQGGQYHLYRYKRYTDVRLVFAPEQQAAFFGGDPDNFEFPRYDLDITVFRVYENGKPVHPAHYLRWNPEGTRDGDLVFVTGHPGSTQRLITMAEMEYARDVQVPGALRYLKSREVLLESYSKRSAENARRARDELFGIQNSRKVYDGRIAGLLDPGLMDGRRAEEDALRRFADSRPELDAAGAWDRIAEAQATIARNARRYNFLEGYNFNSSLFEIARKLLRASVERAKPDGERLREYRDSAKAEFELALFSEEPIYPDFEILKLTHYLQFMAMELGGDDSSVRAALLGAGPDVRAAQLVKGTRLGDVAERRRLYVMSAEQIAGIKDPMLELARAIDAEARAARKVIEEQNEIKQQAQARIAAVRYAKDADRVWPDATFTLRMSFGVVKGYEQGGERIEPYTRMGGMFERSAQHANQPPFDLPESWMAARGGIRQATPFNFVSTAYIIGGNSGSPVINRDGEFVGIVFDGNIQTLVWNYAYSDTQARAVAVDVRAILEAMRSVYGAGAVADEILGRAP